jgi:hypothetical protein
MEGGRRARAPPSVRMHFLIGHSHRCVHVKKLPDIFLSVEDERHPYLHA